MTSRVFEIELDMHFMRFDNEDQPAEMSKMWKYALETLPSKGLCR